MPVPFRTNAAGTLVGVPAEAGLAGGGGAAACSRGFFWSAGASCSPMNCSLSLPAMATFITLIQIGRAALAPVSLSPRDWRLS